MLYLLGFILILGGVGTIETVHGPEGFVQGALVAGAGVLCMIAQLLTDEE